MRRLLLLLPLLPLAFWLLARPPSRFALEESARDFQAARSERWRLLSLAIGDAEAHLLSGRHPEAAETVLGLKAERDRSLLETREWSSRGWSVTLHPASAGARGAAEGALVLDPSGPGDAPPLRGPMEVRVRAKGRLALLWERWFR